MRRDSSAAIAAWPAESQSRARQINFAHYALPNPGAILRARDSGDFAHEFVAESALKIVIATKNFDVSVADPRKANTDKGPARPYAGARLLNQFDSISMCGCCEHRKNIGA